MIARQPRQRVPVLGPVLLIGLAAVALLLTSGVMTARAVDRLLQLWPLVLVMLGVQVVVLHLVPGRAGTLTALVAILGVVALGVGLAVSLPAVPATTYRASAPVAGVAAGMLRLDAGGATLHLTGQELGGDLYRSSVASAAGTGPAVDVTRGTVHLAAPRSGTAFLLDPGASASVDVALSSRVPWAVTIDGAGLSGRADLSALDVSGVTLNGVGTRLDLRLPAATRGPVAVDMSGVGLDLTVRVPRQAGVHVVVAGLGTGLQVNGAALSGLTWSSPDVAGAAGRYEIRVSGVGCHVRLETMT